MAEMVEARPRKVNSTAERGRRSHTWFLPWTYVAAGDRAAKSHRRAHEHRGWGREASLRSPPGEGRQVLQLWPALGPPRCPVPVSPVAHPDASPSDGKTDLIPRVGWTCFGVSKAYPINMSII